MKLNQLSVKGEKNNDNKKLIQRLNWLVEGGEKRQHVRETWESIKELCFIFFFFSRGTLPLSSQDFCPDHIPFIHFPLVFFASSVEVICGIYPYFSEETEIWLFALGSSLSSALQGILRVNFSSWISLKIQGNAVLLPFKPTLWVWEWLRISKKFSSPANPPVPMSPCPSAVSEAELNCSLSYAFRERCSFSPNLSWCCFYENDALSFLKCFSFNSDLDLFVSVVVCFPLRFLCISKFERAIILTFCLDWILNKCN